MKKLLLGLGLLLLCSFEPQTAEGQTCPTRQPGTNDNSCASTAFVQTAVSGGGALTLPQDQIFVGNALNVATAVALSGDCTIISTGVITCTASPVSLTGTTGVVVTPNPITGTGVISLANVPVSVLPVATASTNGIVKPDGTSVTIAGDGTLSAISETITVGSTNITAGTSTRVLYDNAGVLGEYAISGTGSVAMTSAPTIASPTFTGTVAGTNTVPHSVLSQAIGASFLGNPNSSSANVAAFRVQDLTNITTPSSTLDLIPIWNHTTGTIQYTNASQLTSSVGSGVTSIEGMTGVITCGSGLTCAAGSMSATGGGSAITVGTTSIVSGTTTRVLYNNGGVVGEYTITGTGSVVLGTSPTIASPTFSGTVAGAGTIPNSVLVSSAMTIGGQAISLGGTTTNQGTGGKLQLATGTTTTDRFLSYNAAGDAIDSGILKTAVATSATAPVTLTSGVIACATCATTTSGGALTATSPMAISAGGVISITGTAGRVLAGSSPAFTATPTLGIAGTTLGTLALTGNTSGTVTIQPQAAAGTYNFNLPTSAGTTGQPLLSGGGGATAQSYGTLGVAVGGTNTTSYTKGDILVASAATTLTKLAVGANGLTLQADSTQATGVKWGTAGSGDVIGPSSSIRAGTPAWAGTTGKILVDGKGPCNVLAYGAVGDDTTDDTAAIQSAVTACALVYFPASTYKVTSAITWPNTAGGGAVGDGPDKSIINSTASTGNVFTSGVANGLRYENFSIKRTLSTSTIQPTGANCPVTRPATSGSGLYIGIQANRVMINNLRLTNNYDGITTNGTSFSEMNWVFVEDNRNIGLSFNSGGVFSRGHQWQLSKVLAQCNGSHGVYALGIPSCTAVGNCAAIGNWADISTFANGGDGIRFDGVWGIRLANSFFGSDGGHEVHIVSGGDPNYAQLFTNITTEGAGAGVGSSSYGFLISSSESPVSCINCTSTAARLSGFINAGTNTVHIHGGNFAFNGQASVAGNSYGILCNSGAVNIHGAHAPAVGVQTIGIVASSASCTFLGSVANKASISNSAASSYVVGTF